MSGCRTCTQPPKPRFSTFNGIRYNAAAINKIAYVMLENGVKLTVYPEKHRRTREFVGRCSSALSNSDVKIWSDLCLMKAQIRRTTILVLLQPSIAVPDYVCNYARKKMGELLTEVLYLSHRNRVCYWNTKMGEKLLAAIACGMAPGTAATRMQALIYR